MMCGARACPPATTSPRKSPTPSSGSWRDFLAEKKFRIAVIAGDGIGKEVVPEGQRVLEAAGRKFGFSLTWDEKPWSCEHYAKHGKMMPDDGLAQIRNHDSIFLGAVGFPGVPGPVLPWGLLPPLPQP